MLLFNAIACGKYNLQVLEIRYKTGSLHNFEYFLSSISFLSLFCMSPWAKCSLQKNNKSANG